jgi:asparagine synthase (glutamine-hydrolysing)
MCGIAGRVGLEQDREERLRRMINALRHRGPDSEGFHEGCFVSLGQSRLSINDIENGRQPMFSDDGNLVLVANGEIYNSPALRSRFEGEGYRFTSHSDVEVILPLYRQYGEHCVHHLRGMFAFAIYDSCNRTLFLARDHLGQKPLFYRLGEDRMCFASEIKAILAADTNTPAIDTEALWHYMSMRYIPDTHSLFSGIFKLPAATTLTWREGRVVTSRYWEPDFNSKHAGSDEDLLGELDQRLKDTVSSHLLSDVPVGAFLSGGIDSGLITALMASRDPDPVRAFAIGVRERGWNEIPHARQVAEKYNMNLSAEVASADLVSLIPDMVYHLDEPADPYGVGMFLVARLASRSVRVVLSGDGGDESFAGYDRYAGQQWADLYGRVPAAFRNHVLARGLRMIPDSFGYKSVAAKARWLTEMANIPASSRYAHSLGYLRFTPAHKAGLFTPDAIAEIGDADSNGKIFRYYNADNARTLVDRMLYTDLMTRIPDHLCVIADRMCMAHSLENRSPFLDHELVGWVAGLPVHLKLRGHHLKVALRRIGRRYLPENLVRRRKQGFGFPIADWLRGELAPVLRGAFAESRMVGNGLFDPGYMDRLLNEHLQGRVDHNYRLWMLLNIEVWHRIHIEGMRPGEMSEHIARWMHKPGSRYA